MLAVNNDIYYLQDLIQWKEETKTAFISFSLILSLIIGVVMLYNSTICECIIS